MWNLRKATESHSASHNKPCTCICGLLGTNLEFQTWATAQTKWEVLLIILKRTAMGESAELYGGGTLTSQRDCAPAHRSLAIRLIGLYMGFCQSHGVCDKHARHGEQTLCLGLWANQMLICLLYMAVPSARQGTSWNKSADLFLNFQFLYLGYKNGWTSEWFNIAIQALSLTKPIQNHRSRKFLPCKMLINKK